ncbi:hypothetical protein PIB30_025629 [Stylosanthes scabra]|uniref:Uncharacterized protein n=1 Tax=Stylosanthes scabra TaxID=79078 RepID=A0ABU6UB57_9FABA|nr:hypothetical protein [Stylosanthes scabra]
MAVESAVDNLVLKELVEPAVTRPTAQIPFIGTAVESAVNKLLSKELMEPAVTRPTARILVITVVNPCRRDPTLASRGIRIAVTDLTSFIPIQSYGGFASKAAVLGQNHVSGSSYDPYDFFADESDGKESCESLELKTPPNSEDELSDGDVDDVFPVFA